jgi:hypothetical protein
MLAVVLDKAMCQMCTVRVSQSISHLVVSQANWITGNCIGMVRNTKDPVYHTLRHQSLYEIEQ